MRMKNKVICCVMLSVFLTACNGHGSSVGKYLYCSRIKVLHCDKNCKEIVKTNVDGTEIQGVNFLDTMNIIDGEYPYAYCNICFDDKSYEHVSKIIERNNRINEFRRYIYNKLGYKMGIREFEKFCEYLEDDVRREKIYRISVKENFYNGLYEEFEDKIMYK